MNPFATHIIAITDVYTVFFVVALGAVVLWELWGGALHG